MGLNAKLGQASTRRHNDAEDAIGALFATHSFSEAGSLQPVRARRGSWKMRRQTSKES